MARRRAYSTESLEACGPCDLGRRRDRLIAMDFDVEPTGATPETPAGFVVTRSSASGVRRDLCRDVESCTD